MYQTNLPEERHLSESRWKAFKHFYALELPERWLLCSISRVHDWVCLGWSLRICISNKFLSDAAAAGTGTAVWESSDRWKKHCPWVDSYWGQEAGEWSFIKSFFQLLCVLDIFCFEKLRNIQNVFLMLEFRMLSNWER